jgi:hypothetical protein
MELMSIIYSLLISVFIIVITLRIIVWLLKPRKYFMQNFIRLFLLTFIVLFLIMFFKHFPANTF